VPQEDRFGPAAARFAVVFGATLAAVAAVVGLIALAAPLVIRSLTEWALSML
jgi:hypothetical protein